jgi:chromosome segregation ATPase
MTFPPTTIKSLFQILSGEDTVFHVGPGASQTQIGAYRSMAAALIICEPDGKAADQLNAALTFSERSRLVRSAVKRGGGPATLHRFTTSLLNCIGDNPPHLAGYPAARAFETLSVDAIDPTEMLSKSPHSTRNEDVLVCYGLGSAHEIITRLSECGLLGRFAHVITRDSSTAPQQTDFSQTIGKLKDIGFDPITALEEAPQGTPVVYFRRNRLSREIERLETLIAAYADENQAKAKDWSRADKARIAAEAALAELSLKKDEISAQLANAERKIRSFETKLKSDRAKTSAVQAQLDSAITEKEALLENERTLKAEAKAASKEIGALQAILGAANARSNKLQEQLDAANANLEVLTEDECALRAEVATGREKIAALQATLKTECIRTDGLQEQLDAANSNLETLVENERTLKTEVAAAHEEITALQATLKTECTRADELQEQLDASNTNLETLVEKERALKTEVATAREEITALQATLKTECTRADGLQEKLDATNISLEALAENERMLKADAERGLVSENQKIKAQEEELNALKAALNESSSALETLRAESAKKRRELERIGASAGSSIAELEKQRAAQILLRSRAEATVEELQRQLDAQRQAVEDAASGLISLDELVERSNHPDAEANAGTTMNSNTSSSAIPEQIKDLKARLIETRASRDQISKKLVRASRLQSSLQDDLQDLQRRYGQLVHAKDEQDQLVKQFTDKLVAAFDSLHLPHPGDPSSTSRSEPTEMTDD